MRTCAVRLFAVVVCGTVALSDLAGSTFSAEERAAPLIFDTDIGNDVDDVLALGVIHALESRGECQLLAADGPDIAFRYRFTLPLASGE